MPVHLAAAPWLESMKWTPSAPGESKTLESRAKTLTSTKSKWCEHSLSCSMSTLLLYHYYAFTGFHNLKKLGSFNLSHHQKNHPEDHEHTLFELLVRVSCLFLPWFLYAELSGRSCGVSRPDVLLGTKGSHRWPTLAGQVSPVLTLTGRKDQASAVVRG